MVCGGGGRNSGDGSNSSSNSSVAAAAVVDDVVKELPILWCFIALTLAEKLKHPIFATISLKNIDFCHRAAIPSS